MRKLRVVLEIGVLVSIDCMTHEAAVSGLCEEESVGIVKAVLVSVPELVKVRSPSLA